VTSTPPPPEPYNPPPASRAEAAQNGYAAPPAGYAAPASPTRSQGSNRLGLIAFIASLLAVVIGSILAFFGGIQSGSLAQFAGAIDSNGNVESGALPAAANQIALAAGALSVAAFLVWGAFALWGLIQGIIAGVKNRGRGWGIAAIVLSVVGGGIVFVFFVVGAGIGAAPYAS
jgi:divalent metal cation (Fe/Co/Zn/Cd) transporter